MDDLVGRRVTVRRKVDERAGRTVDEPTGRMRYSDVVGVLLSVGDELRIRHRDGREIAVPASAVHRIKPVPVAARDALELERVATLGWPAPEQEWLGHWMLRAAGGFTGRANSALPLGSPGMPVTQAIEAVIAWYGARGLAPRFAVPIPGAASVDAALDALGWSGEASTLVRTGELANVRSRAAARDDVVVDLENEPDEAWLAMYHYRGRGPVPAIGRAVMLAAACPVFAAIREAGVPVAVARAVVDETWLGVTALEVAPSHRRRGLARVLMAALADWGAERGAVSSYLQVLESNAAANALYDDLGYWTHHRYHYRVLPTG